VRTKAGMRPVVSEGDSKHLKQEMRLNSFIRPVPTEPLAPLSIDTLAHRLCATQSPGANVGLVAPMMKAHCANRLRQPATWLLAPGSHLYSRWAFVRLGARSLQGPMAFCQEERSCPILVPGPTASCRLEFQQSRPLVLIPVPGRVKAGDRSAGRRDLPGRSNDLAITAHRNY
jgi:hypothetical protein